MPTKQPDPICFCHDFVTCPHWQCWKMVDPSNLPRHRHRSGQFHDHLCMKASEAMITLDTSEAAELIQQTNPYHILSSSRSQRDKEGSAASIPEVAQCCGVFFYLSYMYPRVLEIPMSILDLFEMADSSWLKLEHCWALLTFRRWSLMLMILENILSDLKIAKVQDNNNNDNNNNVYRYTGGLWHEKCWTLTFSGIRVLSRFSLFQHSTNSLLKNIQGIYHLTA